MCTTLCSMKDKIIFSLCDLRGLCGGKITLLLLSALQKLTTEHTEYTERVRVMNKFLAIGRKNVHNPMFNER